jgi:hypothetical protein
MAAMASAYRGTKVQVCSLGRSATRRWRGHFYFAAPLRRALSTQPPRKIVPTDRRRVGAPAFAAIGAKLADVPNPGYRMSLGTGVPDPVLAPGRERRFLQPWLRGESEPSKAAKLQYSRR